MITASPEQQRLLLELQAHVSAGNLLSRQRREALEDPELLSAREVVDAARLRRDETAADQRTADAEVQRLEDQAAKVAERIKGNEAKLMSGQAGASTLQGLQREIESLTATAAELEDEELSALDSAESAATDVEAAESALAYATDQLTKVQAEVDARVAELDGRAAEESAARASVAAGVPEDLLADFEDRLSRHGVGVAKLVGSVSGGSGMALSPGDLAQIRAAAEDEVVYCPDSGVILIRE
ncbi:MAG: zinc ribbon domain-containing protein [Galactobacter sp.]|uniref:zinc ribbon domain-containing protein n=1 Tax=Galactobacter sp. TaxID=2676125 RepID=UPI0025BBD459|nr:C4-type zinc ribbon domain-containing protein [Galactobacter sp.]